MIFSPKDLVKKEGSFSFVGSVNATSNACIDKNVISELWHGFTFHFSTLKVTRTDGFVFSMGTARPLSLDGSSYAINVENDGVYITAKGEKDLITGFMTLIDRIYAEDEDGKTVLKIDCCEIKETPMIQNRMVHFCVFPETQLWELERFVRLCASLRYTHVIVEFWGMLKYDCMKELSWSFGFTKEQIRPIINTAKDLGLEIIPMFNHWGHASASRVMHGKHVVLDQNPSLQTYFSEDGWCWDIKNPKVRALLAEIRGELVELFGDSEYFHIGCDEAYNYDLSAKEGMDAIAGYINGIAEDMKKSGKRVIVWGDMFLYKHASYAQNEKYYCHAPSAKCEEYMLKALDRSVIIADWQYYLKHAPWETSLVFKKHGFDTLVCPWDQSAQNVDTSLATVKENDLFGIIHTTWHTLSQGMPFVMRAAIGCFEETAGRKSRDGALMAAHLRKVYWVEGDYEKAGWAKKQIGIIT